MNSGAVSLDTNMKKLIQYDNSGIDGIELAEVNEPHAGPGEVRVTFVAGGVNPIDWKVASGAVSPSYIGREYPIGFGSDFSGVIDEVGEGVSDFAIGDEVLGTRMAEGFGEFIVGKPQKLKLLHVPAGFDLTLAGGLATVAATAVAAIDVLGDIAGKTIVVAGGAGGVGTIAVQYAVAKGARVLATGSASSADYLRELGAEPVTRGEGLTERIRQVLGSDELFAAADLINLDVATAAQELGVPNERISLITANDFPEGMIRTGGFAARPEALAEIVAQVADGTITVPVELAVPLADFRTAIERSMEGHAHGKVIITA